MYLGPRPGWSPFSAAFPGISRVLDIARTAQSGSPRVLRGVSGLRYLPAVQNLPDTFISATILAAD